MCNIHLLNMIPLKYCINAIIERNDSGINGEGLIHIGKTYYTCE